ncbi:NAD(P)/FAD-dependent oxidoreductase [Stutzerimonas chloritidismutans]|uniref:NAD(P)/FAD-dependent oxidoreductase n=1 Tax=Stutzerimonas chloritidismutans TaxID=203192 RepID=UPI003F157D62
MKIAIIGSGISGLTCAYLINRRHQVTVFEASSWIGGHGRDIDVRIGNRSHTVNTGFVLFEESNHPNFTRLLDRLGVAFTPVETSFSVSDPATGFEFSNRNLNALLSQRRNVLSLSFWHLLREIQRFRRDALDDYDRQRIAPQLTLGEYLRLGGYGERLLHHYLAPMGALAWLLSPGELIEFPMQPLVRLFKQHGLLASSEGPRWYAVQGGTSGYLPALTRSFAERIRTQCPVQAISRDPAGVTVISPLGEERFDKVVFACHSDQALRLIDQPTTAEREVLGTLGYVQSEMVLHTDTRLLPRRASARASWNYRLGSTPDQLPSITYNLNVLQGLALPDRLCLSINQGAAIDPARVLHRFSCSRPFFSRAYTRAQAGARDLQGINHSYFCGAYWGNGLHEDGVTSAMRVALAIDKQR